MLTEIEWWGGLILIWIAIGYWFSRKVKKEDNILYMFSMYHIAAFFTLAMYFYDLTALWMKYLFIIITIGVIGGLLFSIILVLVEVTKKRDFSNDIEETDEDPENEITLPIAIVALILLYGGTIMTIILAIPKSWQLINELYVFG